MDHGVCCCHFDERWFGLADAVAKFFAWIVVLSVANFDIYSQFLCFCHRSLQYAQIYVVMFYDVYWDEIKLRWVDGMSDC